MEIREGSMSMAMGEISNPWDLIWIRAGCTSYSSVSNRYFGMQTLECWVHSDHCIGLHPLVL